MKNMKRIYTDSDVMRIIGSHYPDFEVQALSILESGHDSEAYLINNEFVFKFPKHQKSSTNLYNEINVLLEIEGKLPIPIPEIKFIGNPNEIFHMYFIGYRKIDGITLTPALDMIFPILNEEEREKIDKVYKDLLNTYSFFDYHKCLIHNDFSANHILFDKNTERISGIIDFGDVAISDPDNDFMCLLEDSDEEYGKREIITRI